MFSKDAVGIQRAKRVGVAIENPNHQRNISGYYLFFSSKNMYFPTECTNRDKLRHHMSHVPLGFEDCRDQRIKPYPVLGRYPADAEFPLQRSEE